MVRLEQVWLPWKSDNLDHGLAKHLVNPDGTIQEKVDLDKPNPKRRKKKKPKHVSTRDWERK